MDIIFQSGEFYGAVSSFGVDLLKNIITIVAALIGASVALWISHRNQRIKEDEEERKRIKFEKDKVKYFYSLLNPTVHAVESQLKSISIACEKIAANPVEFPPLSLSPFLELDRIVNKINQEEHYHAYLNQIKDYSISDFFSILDFFKAKIEEMKDMHTKASGFDTPRKKELRERVKVLDEMITSYLNELSKKGFGGTQLFGNLINIHKRYEQQLNTDTLNKVPSDLLAISKIISIPVMNFIILPNEFSQIGDVLQKKFESIKNDAIEVNKLFFIITANNEKHKENLSVIAGSIKEELNEMKEKKKPLDIFILAERGKV